MHTNGRDKLKINKRNRKKIEGNNSGKGNHSVQGKNSGQGKHSAQGNNSGQGNHWG